MDEPPRSPTLRRLSRPARIRRALRDGGDRVLAADYVWTLAFVVVVSLLLSRCGASSEHFSVGQEAPYDITVQEPELVTDHDLTRAMRDEARRATPDVYVHDRRRGQRLDAGLGGLFEAGRRALASAGDAKADPIEAARAQLAGRLPDSTLAVLAKSGFSSKLETELRGVLRRVMGNLVVGSRALLEQVPAIILVHEPGREEERVADYQSILDLDAARESARLAVLGDQPDEGREVLAGFVAGFIDANVFYDPGETEARRQAAAAAIQPVQVRVPRGTVLVARGEKITEEILERLEAARDEPTRSALWIERAGVLVVVALLAFFLFRYTRFHQRYYRKVKNLYALLVGVLLLMVLLARGLLWIAAEITPRFTSPFDQLDCYPYMIPLGAGAMLIALLANGRIAMVYSAFTAVVFGGLMGWDAFLLLWALIVQWVGIYAVTAYRERVALLRAGLVVGGAGAAAALAVEAARRSLEPLPQTLYGVGLAFVGGAVGVGLLVSFTLPILEKLFNVLTDIRLLELSNVNNPLLSELALKAPGSYNHSLVVGTLAEEGAKAIGANSLFCRVAAFYHDIGKICKPEYYVENQRGENPHDRLTPSMSSLIIAAHVKDGIRMAREAGLPEQIVDIIPQHHGTRLMTYFYEKARRNADPSSRAVLQEDFRYPGPKPKTREAAIFMLADAVEAAARTVDEPTPARLKEVIQKVSGAIVLDGQLDECDLTFADLDRIRKAFLRILLSTTHQRVDYPGFEFGRARAESKAGEARVARGS